MNEREAFVKFKNILDSLEPYSIDLSLDRIKAFLQTIGNPQNSFKSIIIGGTNGKGSVCQFLTDAFIDADFKVGTYTSPHLIQINERFRINNKPMPYSRLLEYAKYVKANQNGVNLTYFEFLTALAFVLFKDLSIDIAVLEVGMGGEFDATNVVDPILSVIAKISLDHEDHLGNTIDKIALTKSKIIKNIGVVAKNSSIVINVIKQNSRAKLFFVSENYLKKAKSMQILMHGYIGCENLSTALLSIDVLNKLYGFNLKYASCEKSFWPGRFEVIKSKEKTYILDGAHNKNAVFRLILSLKEYENKTLIFSSLTRKDWKNALKILMPHFKTVKLVKISHHKLALDTEKANEFLKVNGYRGIIEQYKNVNEAIISTFKESSTNYVIAGSLYLIGEAKACTLNKLFLP